jgi:CheY-like chemotaxis protein
MRIFLVDDDEIFNTLHDAVIRLTVPNADIQVFKTGNEILQYIRDIGDGFLAPQLLFLDIRMPDMNGFEFLELVETQFPEQLVQTKIYMLSSTLNEKDLKRANENKLVVEFISKPLLHDKFQEIYQSALN